MDCGHQAIFDAIIVLRTLQMERQTVRGTRSVRYDLHIRRVIGVVDAHDERGVSSSLAGAEMMTLPGLDMGHCFCSGAKAPVASIIYSAHRKPWDAGSIALGKDRDLLSIYGNPLLVSAKFTAEAPNMVS